MQSYSIEAILKATGADKFAKAFENATKNAEKFRDIGGEMKDVGKKMTAGVTLPIVAMGAAIMTTGAKFSDQMSTVEAVTGAAGDEMKNLRELAKDMGKTTRYSASEAGEGMEMLARAGFETDEIMSALPDTLNLAASGGVELGEAADIVSNILSGFGLEAEETAKMTDILAKASADSNVDVNSLGEAFKYVAPIASTLGVSVEDTAAAIGVMGDAGIAGGQAGNMLKRGLLNLSAPTEKQTKLMNDLDVKMFDAEGNMKSLPDVMKELEDGLGDMTSQDKIDALETMFGSQAVAGFSALLDEGSEGLGTFSSSLSNSEGVAGEMADTMEDNLAGSMRTLKSALEGLAIGFSEMGEGPIRSLVDWFTNLIQKFSEMDDSTKQWIMIIAGVAAAIGPVLWVVGQLIALIPVAIAVFKALGVAIAILTSPIGLVVAALVAAVALIIVYWEPISEFFMGIWNKITEAFETAVELIKAVFMSVYDWLEGHTDGFFGDYVELIQGYLMAAWEIIEAIWEFIKETFKNGLDFIKALVTLDFSGMKDAMSNQMENAKNLLSKIWNSIKTNIINKLVEIYNSIKGKFTDARDKVYEVVGQLKDKVKEIFGMLMGIVTGAFDDVKDAVTEGIGNALGVVVDIKDKFLDAGANIVNSIAKGITGAVDKVKEAIGGVVSKIRDFLPFSPAKDGALKDIMDIQLAQSIAKSIDKGKSTAVKSMRELTNNLQGVTNEFEPELSTMGVSGQVDKIHSRSQRGMSYDFNNELSVSKQPANINVRIGNSEFNAFVDDISTNQNRKSFRGRKNN